MKVTVLSFTAQNLPQDIEVNEGASIADVLSQARAAITADVTVRLVPGNGAPPMTLTTETAASTKASDGDQIGVAPKNVGGASGTDTAEALPPIPTEGAEQTQEAPALTLSQDDDGDGDFDDGINEDDEADAQ